MLKIEKLPCKSSLPFSVQREREIEYVLYYSWDFSSRALARSHVHHVNGNASGRMSNIVHERDRKGRASSVFSGKAPTINSMHFIAQRQMDDRGRVHAHTSMLNVTVIPPSVISLAHVRPGVALQIVDGRIYTCDLIGHIKMWSYKE